MINHNDNKNEKENRCHRYDIKKLGLDIGYKYNKYKKCLRMMTPMLLSNTEAVFEARYMKKLSNTEAELIQFKWIQLTE